MSSSGGEPSPCCCGAHLFTSLLLGALACVLMTGGVFLAFHRWDALWLIVSLVGVVLIVVGSLLHCCAARETAGRGRCSGDKQGCCRAPEHHPALNGSLAEQLLPPLASARSVSQLSLNMLPGYFPPTYGIAQHSAVVQNIGRLIQQQQVQQQAQPACAQPPGSSFIVLSLPAETDPAVIHNLVASVYQVDESGPTEDAVDESTSTPCIPTPAFAQPPVLRSVEVQTCSVWPPADPQAACTSTHLPLEAPPAGSDADPLCDTSASPASGDGRLSPNIPSDVLVDCADAQTPASLPSAAATLDILATDVVIDMAEEISVQVPPAVRVEDSDAGESESRVQSDAADGLVNFGAGPSHAADALSVLSEDADDGGSSEGRSSPPPSYDDVAQEGDTSPPPAFNLANYGTI